jgi:potassium-transporting ATPase KdpC subunit
MRRQLVPAVLSMIVFTVVLGLIYPLVITVVAQVLFNDKADGSIIDRDGQEIGSALIGQQFTEPIYFWPRPSAVGEEGYDASTSGGSNLGPTNPDLLAAVGERVAAYRAANGLSDDLQVPVDAVTTSGSGLDPHISVANAEVQASRVADARDASLDDVLALVDEHTEGQSFGFLGEKGVNVLELNLALDEMLPS